MVSSRDLELTRCFVGILALPLGELYDSTILTYQMGGLPLS